MFCMDTARQSFLPTLVRGFKTCLCSLKLSRHGRKRGKRMCQFLKHVRKPDNDKIRGLERKVEGEGDHGKTPNMIRE